MRTSTEQFTDSAQQVARWMKALSHPARIEIMRILSQQDDCVCGDIVADLPIAQSTVSQHLRVLKDAGLIQGTVDGPRVCYCLNFQIIRSARQAIESFFEDIESGSTSCC